jgi:hypothetical protein
MPMTTPVVRSSAKWCSALPRPTAASGSAPSGPTMMVSAVLMPTWPSWFTTSGPGQQQQSGQLVQEQARPAGFPRVGVGTQYVVRATTSSPGVKLQRLARGGFSDTSRAPCGRRGDAHAQGGLAARRRGHGHVAEAGVAPSRP